MKALKYGWLALLVVVLAPSLMADPVFVGAGPTPIDLSTDPIVITPGTTPRWEGDDPANLHASEISAITGDTLAELYKQDVEVGSDTGPFAANFATTFSNTPSDPEDALIDWLGGAFIDSSVVWLFVKDGNADPAWYLFDLSGWDGQTSLSLDAFWPSRGAISHVALYGGSTSVPEPGSLTLLGIGLLAAGVAARRRR